MLTVDVFVYVFVASLSGDEQTIQQNIERMRHELGPDWLQGVHKALPEPGTGNVIQQNAPQLHKCDVCVGLFVEHNMYS